MDSPRGMPLAPIELTWEDGIFLCGLLLVGLAQPVPSVRSEFLTIFLFFNCLMLAATFWSTGVNTFGYLAVFGLGGVARLWPYPWVCFAAVTVVYMLVYEGPLAHRWQAFPGVWNPCSTTWATVGGSLRDWSVPSAAGPTIGCCVICARRPPFSPQPCGRGADQLASGLVYFWSRGPHP